MSTFPQHRPDCSIPLSGTRGVPYAEPWPARLRGRAGHFFSPRERLALACAALVAAQARCRRGTPEQGALRSLPGDDLVEILALEADDLARPVQDPRPDGA